MTSAIDKHYRTQNNKEKQEKVDAITAVKRMQLAGHTVMAARESPEGYSYHSFDSDSGLHVWMSNIHDQNRHVYGIDLSAWHHKDASFELQAWASKHFVVPFHLEIEWYSDDDLPDPAAADRIAAVTWHIARALQRVGHGNLPRFSQRDIGGMDRRTSQFKNCYLVFAADVLFDDTICMKDFIRTVLIPTLTDDPLLFQQNAEDEQECIVHSRGTMLEMPGCCQQRAAGVPMASEGDLRRFRNSLHVSEVKDQSIISKADVSGGIIQDENQFEKKDEEQHGKAAPRQNQQEQESKEAEVEDKKSNIIQTTADYMGLDPEVNTSYPKGGGAIASRWPDARAIVISGPMGCGKTMFILESIARRLNKPGLQQCKAVIVVPVRALASQMTSKMIEACKSFGRTMKVLNYRSCSAHPERDQWDILICGPRSLYKFHFLNIDTVVVDEGTKTYSQFRDWTDGVGVRQSMQDGASILRSLTAGVPVCVVSCAQFRGESFEPLLQLLGRGPGSSHTDKSLIKYEAVKLLQQTPVTHVKSFGYMLQRIVDALGAGQYVAVCTNVAHFATNLKVYIEEIEQDIKCLAWTAEWLSGQQKGGGLDPAADPSGYIANNRFRLVVYNTSMGPGMSINSVKNEPYFTRRFVVLMAGGADEVEMAQQPSRLRDIDRSEPIEVYSVAPDRGDIPVATKEQRTLALQRALKKHPEERERYITGPGTSGYRMKETKINEARLQQQLKVILLGNNATASGMVAAMDNTKVTQVEWTQVDTPQGWLDIAERQRTSEALPPPKFVTPHELECFAEKNGRIADCIKISQYLPPHVVANPMYRLAHGHSLSPKAFTCIGDSTVNGLSKLENFTTWTRAHDPRYELTWSLSLDVDTRSAAAIKEQPNQSADRFDSLSHSGKVSLCLHMLTALVGSVDISMVMATASQAQQSEISSLQERSSAHQWLTMSTHWKFVKSITKRVKQPSSDAPGTSQDGMAAWTRIMKHIFLTQLGLGSRTSKRTGSTVRIVPASFYQKMNIDVPAHSKWVTSDLAIGFGPIGERMMLCSKCGSAEPTLCLMQGGMPVCTRGEDKHRDMYLPLDVEHVVHKQEEDSTILDVCDKVLRYAGLTDGQASTNTVSLESIKASIAKSDVTFTEDDISYLKTEYNVDITNWKHLVAKDIKKELARIVTKGCGMTLVGKQQCNGGPRYYTWKLHKNKNKNCS
jgi:hypothetical protein